MEELLGDVIRSVIEHSECVSLFVILLLQQWTMHILNTHKMDSLPRKVEEKRQENGRS